MKNLSFRQEILQIQPYVPGKPIEEVKRELGLADVIKLASNENPLGPSPKAQAAVREWVENMHIYPDGNAFQLRQAVAEKLGVKPNQLVFGNGSDEVIKLLAEAFLQPGDEVVMAAPTFSVYRSAALLMGAKPVEVPLHQYRHNLPSMAEAVSDRTKIVFICNPNNPTGTIVTRTEVEAFLQQLPEPVLVVFDEAYFEYTTCADYPDSLELIVRYGPRILTLRTFSKVYGLAGARIGYGVGDESLIGLLERVREPFNTNAAAQVAAVAALSDQEYVAASVNLNHSEKRFLYRGFEELGLEYVPTETNFILVDVGRDCREVFSALLQQGVIVRTGDIFGYPTRLRITIGTRSQNERLLAALQQVLTRGK